MFIMTTRTILVFGKKRPGYGKTLPKKDFWGKVTFWDYRENELIHWRYVLKSYPMLGCSRRGFYFWQINISGNFRHAHFGKSVHFLIFGHFPDDGGGGVPTTLPIWQEPWSITPRDQISRSGIPHFDISSNLKIFSTCCNVRTLLTVEDTITPAGDPKQGF